MSATSSIEWTDRTWNPVRGCSVISPGCVNCYAMKQAHRFSGVGKAYDGLTKQTSAGPQWTGAVREVVSALNEPLSWKKPQRVFVNSMSDLFHEGVSDEFILNVFTVMAVANQHTFQILTKRPERMRELLSSWRADDIYTYWHGYSGGPAEIERWPLPNVWLGVSCENQKYADERIPHLLQTPAAIRFVSAEPLLGPINLRSVGSTTCPDCRDALRVTAHGEVSPRLDWVIVGGESGAGARICSLDWIRSVVQQCRAASVPVFMKQTGLMVAYGAPGVNGGYRAKDKKGGDPSEWPEPFPREFPRQEPRS